MSWFKRRRPTHRVEPVRISAEDRLIAAHWGYTETEWAGLPAMVQVDKREQLAWAPGVRA
jgi:hypothetical protein